MKYAEAATLAEAAAAMASRRFDILILDINLPDGSGIDFIGTARANDPFIPIIVITGEGDIPLAVEAMRRGADNFLTKPVDNAALAMFMNKTLEIGVLKQQQSARKRLEKRDDFFIGENRGMKEIHGLALAAGASDIPVLITGETGTGKGMLAKWIHQQGSRSSNECVELNCSGLRGEMLSREIFGNVRGAFTSADQDRKGLLDIADRGTLFLDEIGDMSIDVQAQFLKVLEDKSYRRLGDVKLLRSNFRLICATHHDLDSMVEFRAVSPGSHVSNKHDDNSPPSPQGAHERSAGTGRLSAAVTRLIRSGSYRRSHENAAGLSLARQYPRTEKCPRTRAAAYSTRRDAQACTLFQPGRTIAFIKPLQSQRTVQEVEEAHIRAVLDQMGGDIVQAAKCLNISRATLYRRLETDQQRARRLAPILSAIAAALSDMRIPHTETAISF